MKFCFFYRKTHKKIDRRLVVYSVSLCYGFLLNLLFANFSSISAMHFTEKKPPNCKVVIKSVQNGAEYPYQEIKFTIALLDSTTSSALIATSDIIVEFSLSTPRFNGKVMTPGADFTPPPLPSELTLSSGQSTKELIISVNNDSTPEGPEQLRLSLVSIKSGPTGTTISLNSSENTKDAYIIDKSDESGVDFTFSKNSYTITILIPAGQCFTKISASTVPNILPTAQTSATTPVAVTVSPVYEDIELKTTTGKVNSAGKYTMQFYARHNLWQKIGRFTLIVKFTDPLTFNVLDPIVYDDETCETNYIIPTPTVKTIPNCSRTFDLEEISFDRKSEVKIVNNVTRESFFPYGDTKGTYKIRETIDNCTECVDTQPIDVNFEIKRNFTGKPVINELPRLEKSITRNCSITLDPATLIYTGKIGCKESNIVPDFSSPKEFSKGEHNITYTLTNPDNGDITQKTQKLIVKDMIVPVVSSKSTEYSQKILETNTCEYSFKKNDLISQITASDNCTTTLTYNFYNAENVLLNDNSKLSVGFHPIILKVLDEDNNESLPLTLTFNVTPNQPSQVTDFPKKDLTVTLDYGISSKSISWDEPVVTTCYSNIVPIRSHVPNDQISIGKYQVTYTYNFPSEIMITKSFTLTINLPKELKKIKIYKVITPNGDEKNDVWHIENIEDYTERNVMIHDDVGNVIYEEKEYDNKNKVWRGTLQNSDEVLPDGFYYYTIFLNPTKETFKGLVMLITD